MERLLLVLDQHENRRVLEEWLAREYDVLEPPVASPLEVGFDLCIVDGPALKRLRAEVIERKQAEAPYFLPFLLVTSRRDIGHATDALWTVVEEVISVPVLKAELEARVRTLLRARSLSLELESSLGERQRLAESLSQRDTFLATAAHELKTPVAALLGYANLLARRYPNRQEPALEAIARQSRRINSIVVRMLGLARLQHGQLDILLEPIDIVAIARDELEALAVASSRYRLSIQAPGPVWALADPLRVGQVLANLLENAVRFSPEGGEIAVEVRRGPDEVVVSVTDRGIGIPVEEQGRIFERFREGGPAGVRSGLGLGLWLSREIVTRHGGRLWFESDPGHGSTFSFSLPAAAAEKQPTAP